MSQYVPPRLISEVPPEQVAQFLDDVITRQVALTDASYSEETASHQDRWRRLYSSIVGDGRIDAADLEAGRNLLHPIRKRYEAAPLLALYWICHMDQLPAAVQAVAQQMHRKNLYGLTPMPSLLVLVWIEPPAGSADVLFGLVRSLLETFAANTLWRSGQSNIVATLVGLLAHLDQTASDRPLSRGRELLIETVAHKAAGRGQGIVLGWDYTRLCEAVVSCFAMPLWNAGLLDEADVDAVLAEFSGEVLRFESGRRPELASWRAACNRAVFRYLRRAVAGDQDAARVVWDYPEYCGIDHFLTACQMLHQQGGQRFRLNPKGPDEQPTAWAVRLLRRLAAPGPDDLTRSSELQQVPAETLQTATLLAPSWARVAEPFLRWPGWGEMARWVARFGSDHTWGRSSQDNAEAEEDCVGPVNRLAIQDAVGRMGKEQLEQFLRHWVARKIYWDGVFYAEAVLGRNAADVEAKFLKRTRQGVIALGMLPDEGDILQRYLALCRFARESRKFATQRHARELAAAELGLANLVVTAGYSDRTQLEWAMEAQLVREVVSDRRWQVGDYVLWLVPGETAEVRVERNGRTLKSVPDAVRQAPEYLEVKEAREQLQDQWDRIRRRLELAMVLGERFDRESFSPALSTPAGQAMIPCLVLHCWVSGSDQPVELLDFRTCAGEQIPRAAIERFQVAHPLDLAEAGSLTAWQSRLVSLGRRQPFNQLFRECYSKTPAEAGTCDCNRFAGRTGRVGPLIEKLKRRGWDRTYCGEMVRRLPGVNVSVKFADEHVPVEAVDAYTMGAVHFWFHGMSTKQIRDISPRLLSEVLRDADWATASSALDPASVPVSREVFASHRALARVLAPAVTMDGEYARGVGFAVHLGAGTAFDPEGHVIELGNLPLPDNFPYVNPDPATSEVISRLLHLLDSRKGSGVDNRNQR